MKIFIIVVYYFPSTVSCAKLIQDLALELRSRNNEVTVITTDENISADFQVSNEGGIRIARAKTGKIKTASRPVRLWNESNLSRTIWRKGSGFFRNNSCDLVIYYSPTIFFGPLVKRLKKLYKCPSYLILRDIFPQWALDAGVLKKGLLYNYFKRCESVNYDAADIIGVESPKNVAYFSGNRLEKKYSVEILYNWSQISIMKLPPTNFRRDLKLENKVVFFFGGNIGLAQDMDNIIRLAAKMKNEQRAFFLIVGDGSEVSRLNALIKQERMTNILIHAPVSQEQYQSMLDEFDVGLVSLDRHLKTYNFPGKMLGYMEHGMPVLASFNEGHNFIDVICENEIGLTSINGDDEAFAANARKLMANEGLRRRLGQNGRTFLEKNFSVAGTAEQILSHFQAGRENA